MKLITLLEQQATQQEARKALLMVQQHAVELDCETSLDMHATAENVVVLKITHPKAKRQLSVLITRPGAGCTADFQSRIAFFGRKTLMANLDDEQKVLKILTDFVEQASS